MCEEDTPQPPPAFTLTPQTLAQMLIQNVPQHHTVTAVEFDENTGEVVIVVSYEGMTQEHIYNLQK